MHVGDETIQKKDLQEENTLTGLADRVAYAPSFAFRHCAASICKCGF